MAKAAGKSKVAQSALYKSSNRWKSNREKRLMRALKRNPGNEEQITAAMSQMVYRRGTAKNPRWSHSMIKEAMLLKEFGGKVPHAVFSANPKVSAPALHAIHRTHVEHRLPQGKVDFSLGARAWSKPS